MNKRKEINRRINEIQQLLSMDENERQAYIREKHKCEVRDSQGFIMGVVEIKQKYLRALL